MLELPVCQVQTNWIIMDEAGYLLPDKESLQAGRVFKSKSSWDTLKNNDKELMARIKSASRYTYLL